MIAHRVAAPVLELAPARGSVAGIVRTAAYLDFDGFVVAVTARGVPLMPNGVAVTDDGAGAEWPPVGAPVRLGAGGVSGAGWRVTWSAADPPVWDPSVPRAAAPLADGAARARGEAILRGHPPTSEGLASAGVGIAASDGVRALLRALAGGEPADAHALLGLGSGLTPEGDDLLAGAAATVTALEPWDEPTRTKWLAAVAPPDTGERTTALSTTLLRLAAKGQAIEPVHALLDLESDRWEPALERLERLGHSTGRCYAAAVGAAAVLACRR